MRFLWVYFEVCPSMQLWKGRRYYVFKHTIWNIKLKGCERIIFILIALCTPSNCFVSITNTHFIWLHFFWIFINCLWSSNYFLFISLLSFWYMKSKIDSGCAFCFSFFMWEISSLKKIALNLYVSLLFHCIIQYFGFLLV